MRNFLKGLTTESPTRITGLDELLLLSAWFAVWVVLLFVVPVLVFDLVIGLGV